jgi:hypothetical protein
VTLSLLLLLLLLLKPDDYALRNSDHSSFCFVARINTTNLFATMCLSPNVSSAFSLFLLDHQCRISFWEQRLRENL